MRPSKSRLPNSITLPSSPNSISPHCILLLMPFVNYSLFICLRKVSDDIEYYRQKDFHERQIGRWEAQIADRQKVLFEITTTIESLRRIQDFWDMSEGEDRKLL